MSDTSQGPGWWEASDGKWYPPESHPDNVDSATSPGAAPGAPADPSESLGPPPGAPAETPGPVRPAGPKSPPSRATWFVLAAIAIVLVVVIVVVNGGGDDSSEPADEPVPSAPVGTEPEPGPDEQAVNEIADEVVEGFAADDIVIGRSEAVCMGTTLVSALGPEQALRVSDEVAADDTSLDEAVARVVGPGVPVVLPDARPDPPGVHPRGGCGRNGRLSDRPHAREA